MNFNFSEFNIRNSLFELKSDIIASKKYGFIFLIFLVLASLSMLSLRNFQDFGVELFFFLLVAILGIILVSYSVSKYSYEKLYKIAFVMIIIFGLFCVFLMPICEPSDCTEHFNRAEITSRGILFPEYTGTFHTNYYYNGSDYVWNGDGFKVIASVDDLSHERYGTILNSEHADDKINHTLVVVNQAFEQNPFYGYLPQAFGILIAKLLDLNAIWMLWLARLGNLVCYAGIVAYAVKKTPIYKIPMIVTACLPMSLFQATSVSSDSLCIALGILIISYFFYMCKSDEKSIDYKDIGVFLLLTLILGLVKLPYMAFSFLIFAIPKDKFNIKNPYFYAFIGIFILAIVGVIWSRFATDALWHSFRATHYLQYKVNATQQLSFLLSDLHNPVLLLSEILNTLNIIISGTFLIYPPLPSGGGYTSASGFISAILPLFIGFVFLAYPRTEEFPLRSRIGALIVLILMYGGICTVQFLTWSPGGQIVASGLSPRYFLSFFALIPFVFGFNKVIGKNFEFDYYALTFTISFMAAMVMAFVLGYY